MPTSLCCRFILKLSQADGQSEPARQIIIVQQPANRYTSPRISLSHTAEPPQPFEPDSAAGLQTTITEPPMPFFFQSPLTRRFWLATCAVGMCSAAMDSLGNEPKNLRWPYEVSRGIFRIHADFEIAPSSEVVAELDRLVSDVREMLKTPEPRDPLHLVLFSRTEEYRRYLAHYYPKLPERRALYLRQRGTAMLFAHRHTDMATDLRHELVHALLNDSQPDVSKYSLPLWLDEGLAEYFEAPAQQRWLGHAHLPEVQQSLVDNVPDLEALERLESVESMNAQHYRDAWAWVHFLMHRRQSSRQLLTDQIDTRRRARPTLPVSRIVELQMPKWREEINEHFKVLAS